MNDAQSATLSADKRKKVLDRVLAALQKRFYEPDRLNCDWQNAVQRHRPLIESANTSGEFEKEVSDLLKGLGPSQERRVKELIVASLHEDISLARLAAECELSTRHFARAFRQSTGLSPHRWLLKCRAERARELLADRDLSLAEIATSCGFADQSHLTRVFSVMFGLNPGAWRRAHGKSGGLVDDRDALLN